MQLGRIFGVCNIRLSGHHFRETYESRHPVKQILGKIDQPSHRIDERINVQQEGNQLGQLQPVLVDQNNACHNNRNRNEGYEPRQSVIEQRLREKSVFSAFDQPFADD
jgi:hypothetical protein